MMLASVAVAALALAGGVAAQNTQTSTSAVYAAQATAKSRSPTSNVKGKAFDRITYIWFENTDYDLAATDPNLSYLASQGITLSNFMGTAHPSEPNYCSAIAGDNFGMDNDNFHEIPEGIYTVIDLLEDKGITWATYQEGMPYAGFEGYSWINQTTGDDDYVRKHHPVVLFNNNKTPDRLAQMKNFTGFYDDLENEKLPQWMFITPNMYNDAHDTGVTYGAAWFRTFIDPLLENEYFMKDNLIVVTFDETEVYTIQNNVFTFLLGGAVPIEYVGTTDENFYDHYSEIATVEANWDLDTLGRWDVGANVFELVAKQTGDTVRKWSATYPMSEYYANDSFAGPLSETNSSVHWPVPNVKAEHNGRVVLPAIVDLWSQAPEKTWYNTGIEPYWGQYPPPGYNAAFDS